ncbi:hypothetical protein ABEB36_013078 [Hypothenemus hampei]|uniref:Uncharacterized protein n=1 Tax=Hypothenemus hampei TaxID=57062 RepID=A0ABD1E9G8_HYPHA
MRRCPWEQDKLQHIRGFFILIFNFGVVIPYGCLKMLYTLCEYSEMQFANLISNRNADQGLQFQIKEYSTENVIMQKILTS